MWNRIAIIVVFLLLALGWIAAGRLDIHVLRDGVATLTGWVSAHPVLAPIGYGLVYILFAALGLPVALALTLGAGALFGFWTGLLVASFSSSIGATLAMLLARYFLRDWVTERLRRYSIPQIDGWMLLSLRLMPVMPYFILNLAMGLTRMWPPRFYVISQFGMLPSAVITVNAGTHLGGLRQLSDAVSPELLLSLGALAILPLIARVTLRRQG